MEFIVDFFEGALIDELTYFFPVVSIYFLFADDEFVFFEVEGYF